MPHPNLDQDLLSLYQSTNTEELCVALTKLLERHVPSMALLIIFRPGTFRLDVFTRPAAFEQPAREYVQSNYKHDLWLKNSPVHPRVVAVRHSDYTPIAVLKKSAFYHKVLKPVNSLHGVSIVAWQRKQWMAMATLHRSPAQGEFSDVEMLIFRKIQPHFGSMIRRLATENEERMRRKSVEAFVRKFPAAFVLLDFSLRIVQINKSGEKRCHEINAGPLNARINKPDKIPVLPKDLVSTLTGMRDQIARGKTGNASSQSEKTVKVSAHNCRVIFIPEKVQRGMNEGLFLIVFDSLTKRRQPPELTILISTEKEMAYAVALGKSNGEIATAMGKSVSTVRHQLSSILRKLDLENRIGIVKMLG
jgi:DNA-binding CsgD family transcriptional regulator